MRPSIQRLIVGALTGAIVLAAIYFSHTDYFRFLFVLGTAAFLSSAVWEFYQMAKVKGYSPLDSLGVMATVVYIVAVFISTQITVLAHLPIWSLFLMLIGAFAYYAAKGSAPIVNLSISFFALIYLTIPLSTLININYFFPDGSAQDGRLWLLYTIAVAKFGDMAAYYLGKTMGKYPLAPFISPKKTWEGAIGGLLVGVLTSICFTAVLPLSLIESIVLGVCVSILAQFGDLAESILKRDAGVKDSNQLPGLGGALDMVDSLVFAVPLVYIFLLINFKGQTL